MEKLTTTSFFKQDNNALQGGQYLIPVAPVNNNPKVSEFQSNTIQILGSTATIPNGYQVVNISQSPGNFLNQNWISLGVSQANDKNFTVTNTKNVPGNQTQNSKIRIQGNRYILPLHIPCNLNSNSALGVPQLKSLNQMGLGFTTASSTNNNCMIQNSEKSVKKPIKQYESGLTKIMEVAEPGKVKINLGSFCKIGNLKIYISESFSPWNLKGRTYLDLNFMRHILDVTRVEIVFLNGNIYEGMQEALESDGFNRILSDWLILKCEDQQIPFYKVNDQIEIYSVNSFSCLLNRVVHDSCLPLPFFTKDSQNILYFVINFPTKTNKILKLNSAIFHDADVGKKKLGCKYPGIRLDCLYEAAIQRFIIHVHKSAEVAYEANGDYIRQLLIYNHIVWGYLQAWTRRVKDNYNDCFELPDIVKNLSLCHGTKYRIECLENKENVYRLGFMDFYLKFDPVALKETGISFPVENFETKYTANVSVVQYYRQFFLINDLHYSDALRNVLLFLNRKKNKTINNLVAFSVSDTDTNNFTKEIAKEISIKQQNICKVKPVVSSVQNEPAIQQNLLLSLLKGKCTDQNAVASSVDVARENAICKVNESERRSDTMNSLNENIPINSENKQQQSSVNEKSATSEVNMPVRKPLIKARTVEEINASINTNEFAVQYPQNNTNNIVKGSEQNRVRCYSNVIRPLPVIVREYFYNYFLNDVASVIKEDSIQDPRFHKLMFDQAVEEASKMSSIEEFLETLFKNLQINFTNYTCIHILNKFLAPEIEKYFPHLFDNSSKNLVAPESSKSKPVVRNVPFVLNIKPTVDDPQVIILDSDSPEVGCNPSSSVQVTKSEEQKNDCEMLEVNLRQMPRIVSVTGSAADAHSAPELLPSETEDPQKPEIIESEPVAEITAQQSQDEIQEEVNSNRGEEYFSKKFNIKPCYVILKPLKLDAHNRLSSKRVYDASDDSDDDFQPPVPAKRPKRISDLEYMEARTRVLQRLRKRREMYIGRERSGRIYKSQELEEFIIRRRSKNEACYKAESDEQSETKSESSVDENHDHKLLYKECLKSKLRVVLNRLENVPEFRHYAKQINAQKDCDADTSSTYMTVMPKINTSHSEEFGAIKGDNSKYFELRDGKLYLKEQYCVKNGIIVPLEDSHNKSGTKGQTPLVQSELDLLCTFIKNENASE